MLRLTLRAAPSWVNCRPASLPGPLPAHPPRLPCTQEEVLTTPGTPLGQDSGGTGLARDLPPGSGKEQMSPPPPNSRAGGLLLCHLPEGQGGGPYDISSPPGPGGGGAGVP